MRFFAVFLLINTFIFKLNAQTITLKVLGKAAYVEYAESNGIIVSFSKSDFRSQKLILSDSIKAIGIKSELIPINNGNFKLAINNKRFRIEENNIERFDKLLIVCNNLKIKIEKVYYKMPIHKFEDEDENAILAFNNASTQAKIISNNLNYKITKVLNIDDDTTESDSIYDIIDKESERGRLVIELLQLLSCRNSLFQNESDNPVRTGGYNLWVTFELKPK